MVADRIDTVLSEISGVLAGVDRAELNALAQQLGTADHVLVAGEGRSGLMAKAFAMRLMHLGVTVHVVGETTTPAVSATDTVVAVSGSGTTAGTVRVAERALELGANLHVITTDPASPLARLTDSVLTVPAATKHRRPGEAMTVQPLSSLFDQATHVVFDVVCLAIAEHRGVDNTAARAAHSNTE